MTSLEKRDEARSAIQPDLFEEGSFLSSAQIDREALEPEEVEERAPDPRTESALALQAQLAQLDPSSLSAKDALLLLYDLHEAAERDLAADD